MLPSGAQNYGSVIAGGPSVAKSFSFTATGTNGGVLIAVLQLQDGATNYGAVPFAFTLGTVTSKFANTNTITINDASPATPYPAVINVSDVPGVISRVTVTLSNLTHSFPGDLDMVLVGPNGQKVMIMSDAGSSANTPNPVNNVTVTFDDAAPAGMTTNQITNGVYKPTNLTIGGADFFPPPGPGAATNFSSVLSAFNGTSPNGAWSLFIIDDNNLDSGVILNGWCLTFTQAAPVNPAGDLAVTMSGPPVATAGQPIIYTLTVTNAGANTADNVVLTNLLPGALTYAPLSNPHGTFFQAGNTAIFQLGSIGVGLSKTLTITANSAGAATVTNVATATSTLTDTNLANNTASVTTVVSQSADLAITLTDSPDAVVINTLLTYSITVVNNGPSTATGVVVTNVLPPTVNFVSGTNAFGLIATNGNIVTATLGSLANGAVANITLVVRPTVTNLITDSASVSSAVSDLNPANNAVSAKTFVIGPPSLVQQQSGGSFVFSWPLVANNFVLECTTNLAPPIVWSAVTNAPVDADPLRVVTIPIDPAAAVKVFRLRQVP
ncbi:MAG: DUF11 domain-containing protein [Verrucomicrobia bacterium]|nr:DUF11 domain-containing protein [Verrucomicrobiota bacterium]